MTQLLIDLGELPRTWDDTGTARPPFPVRTVLYLVLVALLGALTGASHRQPPEPPAIIATRLSDVTFAEAGRLHVLSAGRPEPGRTEINRTISTYRLPAGHLAGYTSVSVSGGVTAVWQVAGTMVVAHQVDASGSGTWAAVALAAGTDEVRWRQPGRVLGISAPDGLALLETADGKFAVDVQTGSLRWSLPHPVDGYTVEAGTVEGFPRWLISVTGAGRLESRDARTGRLLGTATLPTRAGPAGHLIWPAGDLVLAAARGSGYDGYRLPGLDRAWHTTADIGRSWLQAGCGDLICTFHRQWGLTVLDPATGRQLWNSDRWAYAEPAGRHLLATVHAGTEEASPVAVLDPATGRELGDFGRWTTLGPAGSGLLYGVRIEPGHRMHYGTLDPATRQVRILGSATRVSGGCRTGDAVLTCRLIDATVAVWPLR